MPSLAVDLVASFDLQTGEFFFTRRIFKEARLGSEEVGHDHVWPFRNLINTARIFVLSMVD